MCRQFFPKLLSDGSPPITSNFFRFLNYAVAPILQVRLIPAFDRLVIRHQERMIVGVNLELLAKEPQYRPPAVFTALHLFDEFCIGSRFILLRSTESRV